jgi:hypothetical protein
MPMGGERVVVDHPRMVINLNETKVCTLEQMRAVLDGTHALEFTIDSGSTPLSAGQRHHSRTASR